MIQSSRQLLILQKNSTRIHKCNYTILITDHDVYDYRFIYSNSKKIIDCRNKFKRDEKIISA